MTDAYDITSAADFTASAPRPGSPSRAVQLLAVREDIFLLDTRDWDLAVIQPHATEWCEE